MGAEVKRAMLGRRNFCRSPTLVTSLTHNNWGGEIFWETGTQRAAQIPLEDTETDSARGEVFIARNPTGTENF